MCKYLFTLILSCCFLTAGCASNDESVLIPNEQTIKIGVVGHPPMIDEKNIEFTELELGAVSSTSDAEFHALFLKRHQRIQECMQLDLSTKMGSTK
ncbi:hypothetical protein [uncultured Brevibacillus sp.]|uniref:hypothetical protein n=1 Tax=uncultured Brevibacillus sp. TaxID=169970 RepID=UPI0025984667|nr:hypothetical protein [uncultured Brevibacillus sp.]